MALIICDECGKEISDKALTCPSCGAPNIKLNNQINNELQSNKEKNLKKESALGIWGLILSFIFCIPVFPVAGLIMCIIAVKDKSKKTTCAKIGIVFSIMFLIIGCFIFGSENEEDLNKNNNFSSVENVELPKEKNTPKPTKEPKQTATPIPLESKDDFIAKCKDIPYKTVARNPKQYIGEYIVLTVKIEQILQGGFFDSNEYYRVYTNDEYDMWFGDEYFMYDSRIDNDMKLLEEDIIKVYGKFLGTKTVTRALTNTDEEVPSFEAIYIELISE